MSAMLLYMNEAELLLVYAVLSPLFHLCIFRFDCFGAREAWCLSVNLWSISNGGIV